jgi:hypothetical protein
MTSRVWLSKVGDGARRGASRWPEDRFAQLPFADAFPDAFICRPPLFPKQAAAPPLQDF